MPRNRVTVKISTTKETTLRLVVKQEITCLGFRQDHREEVLLKGLREEWTWGKL